MVVKAADTLAVTSSTWNMSPLISIDSVLWFYSILLVNRERLGKARAMMLSST